MDHIKKEERKVHPKEKANIISAFTFFYTLRLFRKGVKGDLEEEDLYEVLSSCRSKKLGDQLEQEWNRQKKNGQKNSVLRLLWACYGMEYLWLGFLRLIIKAAMILLQPYAMSNLISYFTPGQTNISKRDAYFYAGLMIGMNVVNCVYIHNYFLAVTGLGIRLRTAFCSFIYRKALRLSPLQLGGISIGKIVTLITKDVSSFESFIHHANDIWIGLLLLSIVTYITYNKIGLAALAGLGFFIVILPLQVYMGKSAARLRTKMCKKTDERLQLTQEILSAIKIIKMYTWEKFFKNKVMDARKKEIRAMHMTFYLKILVLQIGALSGKIAFYLIIMAYIWFGNHLSAGVVYYIEFNFQIMSHTMSILFPLGITQSAELMVSMKRIGNVLKALEVQSSPRTNEITSKPKVTLKNVSFKYKGKEILQNVNLNIEAGLTLVTGPVGCGKSFLLKTILQDYEPTDGGVVTQGRVSYASQEPWMFPSSIKQNILFGEKLDSERYQEVLKVCALIYDFDLLPEGDRTIVEDRGINLSKGQQARINLARAVYKESEIYLLDDCLSALDAHVSDFIFKNCIMNYLRNKVVIFVSHKVAHLRDVDNVVIMQHGTVKSCVKSSEITEKDILRTIEDDEEEEPSDQCVEDYEENLTEQTKLITGTTRSREVYHEAKKTGEVDYSVYRKYIGFGGGFFAFTFIFIMFGVAQFVHSYSDKLLSRWVNLESAVMNFTASNGTNTTDNADVVAESKYVLNLYSIMICLTTVFEIIRTFALFTVARRASINLHKYMMENIVNATMQFFDTNFIGNILNRFSKDLTAVDEHITFVFYQVFRAAFLILGIMVLIASVNTLFLIPTVLFFILLTILRKYYLPTGRSLKRLDAATRSPVVGHMNATLEGLTTIRAFRAEQILRDEFDRHQDLYTSASYIFQCSMRAFAFSLDIICDIFIATIVLRFLIFDDTFQAGSVGLAITQAFRMTGTLQWGIRQWAEIENSMTSVERVLEYTEVKQENRQGQILQNWPSRGAVQYQNVNLSYTSTKDYVLKDVNFRANPKEKVGIVGRTGAGKSSIVTTMFRLYDVEGKITIDGVDTKTLSLEFLRKHISIIPQDPVLFTGNVRDNIDPERSLTDEEIWRAVELARLKRLIPSLDFEITENGANFSVGQRQLICLARAIARNNKIIVLDEATANMDPETDSLIRETIDKNFEFCTVFTIAHKLQSVINSDKVIVMDKGKIIEYDDPVSLLQNRAGAFYKMVKKAGLITSTP